MPLVRLAAEGVGPFERIDLDLSDGNGNPHLGPHILAGVNGSGKSTVLRTIAWLLDRGRFGFHFHDWEQALKGHPRSRALVVLHPEGADPLFRACALPADQNAGLLPWAQGILQESGLQIGYRWTQFHMHGSRWVGLDPPGEIDGAALFNLAAYSPSLALKRLQGPHLANALSAPNLNCLSFDQTVHSETVQSWLLNMDYGRAKARERSQSGEQYSRSLVRFEAALSEIYGEKVAFEVEFGPDPEPRLKIRGQSLNFSQLPDGVRSTVGWIADYMMREDHLNWDPGLKGKRPGLLLLDEIDAHLHPLWQRLLLPAMREALPDVQMIVTSHSPFVISSCPNSRVHVLKLDQQGRAYAEPPVDSPIGESVATTLKEIFGVDSRFDVKTERELNEWNDLKKREVTSSLSKADKGRLSKLTATLSERSEELRSIVASPLTIPKTVLHSLLDANGRKPAARRSRKRGATVPR
jgi:hypothetical protein